MAAGRGVTLVHEQDDAVAALVHDPAALADGELAASVAAAVRLAVANAGMQAQIATRLREVDASRRRLVEAGDDERRRLGDELQHACEDRLAADLRPAGRARRPPRRRAARADAAPAVGRARRRARRPGAVRPGHPSAGADRARARCRPGRAGRAGRDARGPRRHRTALRARPRGGGLLRLLGGPGQRRQVRARDPCATSRSRRPTTGSWCASKTTARAAPTRPGAPACGAWPTASRRSAGRCASRVRPVRARGCEAHLPIAHRPPAI